MAALAATVVEEKKKARKIPKEVWEILPFFKILNWQSMEELTKLIDRKLAGVFPTYPHLKIQHLLTYDMDELVGTFSLSANNLSVCVRVLKEIGMHFKYSLITEKDRWTESDQQNLAQRLEELKAIAEENRDDDMETWQKNFFTAVTGRHAVIISVKLQAQSSIFHAPIPAAPVSNAPPPSSRGVPMQVRPERILNDKEQPRIFFDEHEESLVEGFEELGQLQDVIVVELQGDPNHDYKLVDGERRWRASLEGKEEFLWVVVRKIPPEKIRSVQIAMNFNRKGHHPLEIAFAVRDLLAEGKNWKQMEKIFGLRECSLKIYNRLNELHPAVQDRMKPNIEEKFRVTLQATAWFLRVRQDKQYEILQEVIASVKSGKEMFYLIKTLVQKTLKEDAGSARHSLTQARQRTPRDEFRVFAKNTQNILGVAEHWKGVPPADFKKMFAYRGKSDREKMKASIKATIEDLNILLQEISEVKCPA